jgi:hypothetical protein
MSAFRSSPVSVSAFSFSACSHSLRMREFSSLGTDVREPWRPTVWTKNRLYPFGGSRISLDAALP